MGYLSRVILRATEALGMLGNRVKRSGLYLDPWVGLNGLDKRLNEVAPWLRSSRCFYIEAGANNGIRQSNTLYMEMKHRARGMLIEASQYNFELCKLNRSKRNIFEHCALDEFSDGNVEFDYLDLMTIERQKDSSDRSSHIRDGEMYMGKASYKISCPRKSLWDLIEKHNIERVDLLSLDVEGGEMQVLRGARLEMNYIESILVETEKPEEVKEFLRKYGYHYYGRLSFHDHFFTRRERR